MWENMAEPDAKDNNTAHTHCLLDNKATDTHSEYVTIPAFPCHQCYVHMYIAFLVSLPEAVIVTDAVTSSDGRKTNIF
jgi:deoxycytidylate deaminase